MQPCACLTTPERVRGVSKWTKVDDESPAVAREGDLAEVPADGHQAGHSEHLGGSGPRWACHSALSEALPEGLTCSST